MSRSNPDVALSPSWRPTAIKKASTPRLVKLLPQNPAKTKPNGAVTYAQPSGVDVFPGREFMKTMVKKLRRS